MKQRRLQLCTEQSTGCSIHENALLRPDRSSGGEQTSGRRRPSDFESTLIIHRRSDRDISLFCISGPHDDEPASILDEGAIMPMQDLFEQIQSLSVAQLLVAPNINLVV